jgi:long-chain acyl-CoA synthetase
MTVKSWNRVYDEGVPPSLQPYPRKTLVDVVRETAEERPSHPALRFLGATVSYRSLDRWSTQLAVAFTKLGVRKGDRIAILMPNSPQAIISQLAAWKAGAIAAPINAVYKKRELVHALREVSPRLAVVLTPFYGKLKEVQSQTPVETVVATAIKEYFPPRLRLLFTLLRERKEGHRITLQPDDFWLQDLVKRNRGAREPDGGPDPEDPALLLFTGGTTGEPKAALGSHGSLFTSGTQLTTWFRPVMDPWTDGLLGNMPLSHVYGNAGVLSTAIVNRAPLILVPDPRDLNELLGTIEKDRPAFLPGVPTLFQALLRHPKVRAGEADLSSIKLCVCGAAPLLADLKERFEQATGGRMIEGWAMTETMMGTLMTPVAGEFRSGAIGVPLPDIDVKIVDVDTGEDSPKGESGEILVQAPQVMREYWGDPEATAEILRNGWVHTGDIGYQDDDGYVYIVDRKKDLIKPSGFQVWPREVEEVITSHPSVSDAAVAGIRDPTRGEIVKAWVVLAEGESLSAAQVRAHCREHLTSYKVPRQVEFLEDLPKSAVGKVLRRKLAEME